MTTLQQIAAAEPVKNWAATREDIIESIKSQIDTHFEPVETTRDPLTDVIESCTDLHTSINKRLYEFNGPPFTIQRLAELAYDGSMYYKSLPKYLRALQHVLSVTSVVDDFDDEAQKELLEEPPEEDVVLEQIGWMDD